MTDRDTVAYFDEHTPEYGEYRFDFALERIAALAGPETALCDVGCGVGNILALVGRTTGVRQLCGIDASANCLALAAARAGCETRCGSVLDPAFVAGIGPRFDVVLLAAVLHHLVGATRAESRRLQRAAVENCFALLKDGGRLFVLETTFSPRFAMWLVFWVKRLITRATSRRIGIFGKWNNIGAPVVSYFTDGELTALLGAGAERSLEAVHREELPVNRLLRLALITRKTDVTVIVRKGEAPR